jgi:hypothetical protein
MNPYYLMALLYLALAVLAALDTSLVNLQILPSFSGQRWLLVHSVTLGALVELVFGLTPDLSSALNRLPRPSFRWNTWFLLNAGLIVLYAGIPMINAVLITTGGTLVFLAASLLMIQLAGLAGIRPTAEANLSGDQDGKAASGQGTWFYLAGLFYLMVGILVGTGLWLGWAGPLQIVTPKEVHVHSNLWGFASMILAGILFDLYPGITGRRLAHPRLVTLTFWSMAVGTLGMVLGPWFEINSFTVSGLVLHTIGTLLMLYNLIKPVWRKGQGRTAGLWHLALAYIWFLLAVVVAPLVVAGGEVGAEVAGSGGPILIFGWILQAGYALIPFLFAWALLPGRPSRLGGTWFTLLTVNGGSLLYWISMFLAAGRSPMRGIAYLLWILSLIPILMNLANLVNIRLEQIREQEGRTSV